MTVTVSVIWSTITIGKNRAYHFWNGKEALEIMVETLNRVLEKPTIECVTCFDCTTTLEMMEKHKECSIYSHYKLHPLLKEYICD